MSDQLDDLPVSFLNYHAQRAKIETGSPFVDPQALIEECLQLSRISSQDSTGCKNYLESTLHRLEDCNPGYRLLVPRRSEERPFFGGNAFPIPEPTRRKSD